MNIEKDLREEFDKRGVNYDQNHCINYVDDSFDAVLDCVENVVNKNCNIQNVSIALSGFMDWLWLNHNILTNADDNKIALERYLATL